jgi:hypothetical protein
MSSLRPPKSVPEEIRHMQDLFQRTIAHGSDTGCGQGQLVINQIRSELDGYI